MLPPATQEKISIKGSADFLPELLTYVDIDQLPSFLGGTGDMSGGCEAPRERGMAVALAEEIPKGLGERLVTGDEATETPPMLGSMEGIDDELYGAVPPRK